MSKNLNIDVHHLTRVEGHGDITVTIEKGILKEVRFDVVEAPRYFEAMLLDKKITSAYEITARICGICSISHTLASLNAIEDLLKISVSEQTRVIRSLAMSGELLSSHILHICFLAAPDFLGVPSVIPLVEKDPELVLRALRLKKMANIITDRLCGRHTHPLTLVIGGVTYVPPKEKLSELKEMLTKEMLPDLQALVKLFAGVKLPQFKRETEYICLNNFYQEPEGGKILTSSDGDNTPIGQYRSKIREYVVGTSTAKFARGGRESFMVGALARLNNYYPSLLPEAKEAAETIGLKTPCYNSFANTTAQLVECIHFTVLAIQYVEKLLDSDLKEEELPKLEMRAGTGVGVVEAPRGTLIHEYSTDENGMITGANCIIPTGQNCGNLNEDMKALIPGILEQGKEAITLSLEMLARAYDPCISCSTHMVEVEFRP